MLSQLIIAEPNNIIRMKYEKGKKSFVRANSKSIKNVRKLLKFKDNIIVMRKQEINILSVDFKTIDTLKFNSIGAVYVDSENIYVGADSSFICFDCNIKELSRIKLDFSYLADMYSPKNIDDIIVYNNIACLIDDVTSPLFVFKGS